MGAMIGGTTGGIAGAKLGSEIDTHILKNYLCQDCNFTFSRPLAC